MSLYPDYVESSCRQNYSYFWSADYMRNAYHCTAIVTVPLSLFTFYTIWKITPSRMKNMRGPLLIAHAWSTNLDLMFTVYTAPVIFFPSAAGLPSGVLTAIGVPPKWQAYWGQVSVIMCGVCFVMLYENRHSQISTIRFKIKKHRTRMIYFGANYLMAFVFMLPFYLEDTDQMELRGIVLKRIPCPTIDFYSPNAFVLLKGGEFLAFLSITAGLSLVCIQTLFFLFHTAYHLFNVDSTQISAATRALQKKFLGYVSIQISIPWLALCTPILYSLYADKHDYYNQAYNNNAMLAMSNHGVFASTCTLLIYKPYRDHVKHIFVARPNIRVEDSTLKSRQSVSQL